MCEAFGPGRIELLRIEAEVPRQRLRGASPYRPLLSHANRACTLKQQPESQQIYHSGRSLGHALAIGVLGPPADMTRPAITS